MSDIANKESLNSSLNVELGVLKEIYLNDLVIENECEESNIKTNADIDESGDHSIKDDYVKKFHVNLLPSTADEKAEQFVALTVHFQIPAKYPDEVPEISLKSPRGLSDENFTKIQKGLNELAEKKKGTNMLYELFDFVKESLTAYNFPAGKCMICLYEFTKDDVFTKTNCFHHFHCRCLADYSKSHESSKESNEGEEKKEATKSGLIPCPVCRVDFTLNELLKEPYEKYPLPALSKKPLAEEKDIVEEARQNQEKFAEIYEKQQQKGGLINLEKENEVLHISNSAIANESAKQNAIEKTTQTNNESEDSKESVQNSSESSNSKPDASKLPKDEKEAVENEKSKEEKTENATSSSPVEVTSTTKDKENVKPKQKRRSRRNNRRNRTKSREASHNEQTSNEAQPQNADEQQTRPQDNEHRDRNQNYRSNNRNYRNYNYNNNYRNYNQRNSRNSGSPNMRDYGMNQENGYKPNGYNNYWNRPGYKDRPGYYAPRVFRYSRPRPEMRSYETPNDSNNMNSQTNRRINKGTTEQHQRNAVQNGEGSRHYRRYSDEAYYNGNVQNNQQPRIRYNNYYRQQNYDYNQRSNYDYNQNRFYYPPDNPRYYSSRNSYYNGPNRRYQQVRRTSESGGGRRRTNTIQSQASSKAVETKPSTVAVEVEESTVYLNPIVA